MGEIYTIHEYFRNILNAPIVKIVPSNLLNQTKGGYQMNFSNIFFRKV
jgi:hypothetical protein